MDTEFSERLVRVLHLEDDENDHLLLVEALHADGLNCEFTLARSKEEFLLALRRGKYDLIISDCSLPSYDGFSALAASRETHAETPFVFFSGTIGEDVAVESLKHGAVDYVLKQRPGRLTDAVRRALRNADQRERLRQAKQALRESEERFRLVARATNDVIWEWDIQNKRFWLGPSFEPAFGHPVSNAWIPYEQWLDYIHPEDQQSVVFGISALLATGGSVWWSEHRIRRAGGSYAHIYDRASVIYDEGKPQRMVGVTVDMSERRAADEKIRQQAALLDKASDAIIVCTPDREIIYWNLSAEHIYGWTAAEARGKDIRQLLFRNETAPGILEAEQSMGESGEWAGELQEYTKTGKPVIVRSRGTLIRDDQGNPKAALFISTDITEHKQLEEKFLRAQRLESLGVLVSGIAHDLNNTLVPIMIGVDILKAEPLPEEIAGMVHTMETSVRRSAEMIRQMLAFARGGETSKSTIQLNLLVKEVGKIIADTFPKSIHCRVRTGANLHPVSAIPTQLHQVLMNLCINARDAMPRGGTLVLTVENTSFTNSAVEIPAEARAGDYVCIGVKDTGTGIPLEQLEKIFLPFFTTKAPGKGTGLGLSTCQTIVKQHDGFITVESKVGAGAEFKVYLPAALAPAAESAAPAATVALPVGCGERILVVDDEESVLALTRAALENYGYRVSAVAGGVEAIARFREDSRAFHLVITDQAMPFMDGRAMVAALRKIRSDVKIILSTASEKEGENLFEDFHADGFLSKPFTTEALLTTVNRTLTANL